jgi:hypothetical protein
MDIEVWRRSLGLERYVPAFRDNEIDWEVLPKLTSEDLREIGVAPIGPPPLDAIAALGASAGTAALRAAFFDPSAPADAERRQLTVMSIWSYARTQGLLSREASWMSLAG